MFQDWLHNLHANMGGKGKKGTESIPLLTLPFRFLDTLANETPLSIFYALCTLLGLGWAWRFGHPRGYVAAQSETAPPLPLGRILVVWFVVLYLEYACAPQSVWPWRPVIRDADRFLAGLAVPMSVLAVAGLVWLLQLVELKHRRWGRLLYDYPWRAGAVIVVVLALVSTRSFFSLGFVPEMKRYLRGLPVGTKVFTHSGMREFVYLIDAKSAAGFTWLYKGDIIKATPELERMAAEAGEFWYARKLVWLNTRKKLEQKGLPRQEPLPSYFDQPERDWALARLLAKGDTPDLVFYRRRTPEMDLPLTLPAGAPEWGGLIPPLPHEWKAGGADRNRQVFLEIPAALRGQAVRLELEAASEQVQAFLASLRFYAGKCELTEYVLKPYLYPAGGKEFFVLSLPAEADRCAIQLKFSKDAKWVRFTGFQGIFQRELAAGK